jgi:4-nitrophenyl phosphatase
MSPTPREIAQVPTPRTLSAVRSVLFDLDGCVYVGNRPLPGSREIFQYLESSGLSYCLITNNATKTPGQFVDKLAAMDIRVPESVLVTAGVATAMFLRQLEPSGAPVYIIGESGMHRPLTEAGFWIDERDPKYVCVGLDQSLTYQKLKTAALAIRRGARFIAANPDTTLPTEEGLVPGCGSILSALATATGVLPTVIGKPSREIVDLALTILGADRATSMIIGDRLDTDIPAGSRAGIGTALILTGVHQPADIPSFEAVPDWIVRDLYEFRQRLAGE